VFIIAKQTNVTDEKTTVSARVNATAINIFKQKEVPISDVIEAGIIYFLSLADDDKVAYLLKNNSEVFDNEDFKIPNTSWPECIRAALDLDESASIKDEVRGFKAAAKWSSDKGASRLAQLSLRKLSTTEIINKADFLSQNGQLQEALAYYDYAMGVLKKANKTREMARISMAVGDAYCSIGNFSLALAAYDGAEASFTSSGKHVSDTAELTLARGICFQKWGKYKEAVRYFDAARELFVQLGNTDKLNQTITRMAICIEYCDPEYSVSFFDNVINYFVTMQQQRKDKMANYNSNSN